MSNRFGRAVLVVTSLVALLSSCAAPAAAPPPSGAAPAADPSPSEPAEPQIGPGDQVVPVDCDDMMRGSRAKLEIDTVASGAPDESIYQVALRGTGLLECRFAAAEPDKGFELRLLILPTQPPTWADEIRTNDGTAVDGGFTRFTCWGEANDATWCLGQLAVGHYAAEAIVSHGSLGVVSPEMDGLLAEFAAELSALPAAPAPWRPGESALSVPDDCEGIDLSAAPVAAEIPELASPPIDPDSGDGPQLVYVARSRIGFLHCWWWIDYDRISASVVQGGAWAMGGEGLVSPGLPITVAGTDAARTAPSPNGEGGVSILASVGDDLVLLDFEDSAINGTWSDDETALAVRVLEALIHSLRVD